MKRTFQLRWDRSGKCGVHLWNLRGGVHLCSPSTDEASLAITITFPAGTLKGAGLRNFNVMVVLEAALSVISAKGLAGSWSGWHRHPIWGGISLLSIGRSTVVGSAKLNPDKLIKDIWVNQKDGPIMDTKNRQRSSRSWCCVSRLKGHWLLALCFSHLHVTAETTCPPDLVVGSMGQCGGLSAAAMWSANSLKFVTAPSPGAQFRPADLASVPQLYWKHAESKKNKTKHNLGRAEKAGRKAVAVPSFLTSVDIQVQLTGWTSADHRRG